MMKCVNIGKFASSTVGLVHFFLPKQMGEGAQPPTHIFYSIHLPTTSLDGTLVLVRYFPLGNYRTSNKNR